MGKRRKQLTLFLGGEVSASIEWIRRQFNPVQYRLIKSHITLCREDEIEDLERVLHNLENLDVEEFELALGSVKTFSEGKGVLIPVRDEEQLFRKLREMVLANTHSGIREHKAHITLMHPRNSSCDEASFEAIQNILIPKRILISNISLIEQEMGEEWGIIKEYPLKKI